MLTQPFVRLISISFMALVAVAGAILLLGAPARTDARPLHTTFIVGLNCPTIQACINIANANDTVFIPAKTYSESLTLAKPVNLMGANAATTIINALANQRVLTVTGASITNATLISGLTFANGNVAGVICPTGCGGGILISDTAQPVLQNLIIVNNTANFGGGGVFANGPLTLLNSQIISNSANNGGGVLALGIATISQSYFERNRASSGGGLLVFGQASISQSAFVSNTVGSTSPCSGAGVHASNHITLSQVRFEDHRGLTATSGCAFVLENAVQAVLNDTSFISTTGTGMFVTSAASRVSINNGRFERNSLHGLFTIATTAMTNTDFISNTISNNFPTGDGGGLYVNGQNGLTLITIYGGRFENNVVNQGALGGGLWVSGAVLSITGTRFISNFAGGGGGLSIFASTFTIAQAEFISNSALEGGGLHVAVGAQGSVVNSLFANNDASIDGTAIDFYGLSGGQVNILHTTIASATLVNKAAIYKPAIGNGGLVTIANSIIANHAVGINVTNITAFENYNLFHNVTTATLGTFTSGSGLNDVFGDPRFADPTTDNYHLSPASAAIDKGVASSVAADFDGQARPQGNAPDIGYDEFASLAVYLPLIVR